jgi:hypothetical protein
LLKNKNKASDKKDLCNFGGKESAGYINIFGSIILNYYNFLNCFAIGIAFARNSH